MRPCSIEFESATLPQAELGPGFRRAAPPPPPLLCRARGRRHLSTLSEMKMDDPADERTATLPPIGKIELVQRFPPQRGLSPGRRRRASPTMSSSVFMGTCEPGNFRSLWQASPQDLPRHRRRPGHHHLHRSRRRAGLHHPLYGDNEWGQFTATSATLTFQTEPWSNFLPSLRHVLYFVLAGLLAAIAVQKWRARQSG